MAKHDHDEDLRLRAAAAPRANMRLAPQPDGEAAGLREELRLANERMSNLLESITDGLLVLDRGWRITYINARAEDMLRPSGNGRDHLTGNTLWQALPELRGTVVEAQYRRALECQESVGFELYYLPLKRWLDVRAYPSSDGLTSYLQDITQRKADELALREGAVRLQVALAAGKLGDWSWDAASDLITLGRRAAEMFDLPANTPVTWPVLRERIAGADRKAVASAFTDAAASCGAYAIECRVLSGSGAQRWISIVGQGNFGDDDALLGMTGMVRDVTLSKQADDALRQSEEQLRALANSIPQLAWIAHFDGAVTWFNERWYEYTGSSPGQTAGDGWQAACDPASLPPMLNLWEQSLRSGTPFEMEFPIRGADGQFRWFLTRANPIRDSAGRLLRWFGTSTDVDQVKRVQEALRDESNILELLNSTGSALASTLDLKTLLQQVTDAATRISGARFGAFFYNGTDANGAALTQYTLSGAGAEALRRFPPSRAAALFDPTLRGEGAIRADDLQGDARYGQDELHWAVPDGHPAVRSYLAVPVVSRSGQVLGGLFFGHPEAAVFTARTERIVGGIAAQAAVAIDNTRLYEAAQRAAEERKVLLDSERYARTEAERSNQMKDEFLATLSHELRTPLSAILGWAQVLRRGTRDQADLHRGLQSIERNARAQAQLIEDLLDMSRITSGKVLLEMQTILPATIIDAAIEALRPAAEAKNIRLLSYVGAGVGAIAGDPSRLQQVIWNLLSNALKFTPKDGEVDIRVRQSDSYADITIRDSGIGIRPEFLPHVFERFRQGDASTTRKHGGLGLGLAIVKHLVEQHGGSVSAASPGEGLGASFSVQLPLATASAPARPAARSYMAAAPAPEPEPRDLPLPDLSRLKVLVVDDEADARELIERILSDCNAMVFKAADAAQALQLLLNERPDVLVSDIGMPDVDGFDLLGLVRALGQERGGALPAVALTAFARPEDRQRAIDAGFQAHVAKPVEPSQLLDTVAGLCGRGLR
ncbi:MULTISPECIES: ATP-binding protein [unclassified Janthinobacterium]|uniref:ATP-binding protein n=1 Tax=unclassified Janthinobacterium TaxID=2610881 RepID=UPI00034D76CB|nr:MULTISPECIES: ATP-binding protein [unclassified Janthinobacterium]MEC5161991.1 PAS domain S-box-containing protein [Janthinobacterium sp. CG_S6]